MNRLVRYVYFSRPRGAVTHDIIHGIVEQARVNNARNHVRGLLVYTGPYFVQVLEGDEEVIAELAFRLCDDPRHERMSLLSRRWVDQYHCNWSMGFMGPEGIDSLFMSALTREVWLDPAALGDSRAEEMMRALVAFLPSDQSKHEIRVN